MNFSAGDFNQRIILQCKIAGDIDENGYPLPEVNVKTPVWSVVKTMSAREYLASKAMQSEQITRFIIRYRPQVDSSYTILYKGQTYEIDSVINDREEDKTLTIMAKRVVSAGRL
jgi:SPP1 family predicted phage head-tail adaptor